MDIDNQNDGDQDSLSHKDWLEGSINFQQLQTEQ